MATLAFNTYEFIKNLKDSGLNEKQAEAITTGILQAHDSADVATKGDLRELELRLDKKLTEMKGESILIRWMLGVIIAGIAGLIIKTFFGT